MGCPKSKATDINHCHPTDHLDEKICEVLGVPGEVLGVSPLRKMLPGFLDKKQLEFAVTTILESIREDVSRDGLKRTPERVAKAYLELTAGYQQDPTVILGTIFEGDY